MTHWSFRVGTQIARVAVILGIMVVPAYSQSIFEKMKTVALLKTTRPELERIFGRPKVTYSFGEPIAYQVEYAVKDGTLIVSYSPGRCQETPEAEYDVKAGIVTELTLNFDKKVGFAKFKVDLSGFKRNQINDLPGLTEYRNPAVGEYYQLEENNPNNRILRKIKMFPPSRWNDLRCN